MEKTMREANYVPTIIIGGGQAGLAAGYHLKRRGLEFLILEANSHIGDSWRSRWDSLRLFTPALYDGLDGMPFPTPAHYFPTKDEMGDYLEAYASHFDLPVRTGVRVERLTRGDGRFVLEAGDQKLEADNVIVAMAPFQKPRIPVLATQLSPSIRQLHSAAYRNPSQLQEGSVLIVGAGNSGAEIALELSRSHRVLLSGNHPGHIPFRIEGRAARLVLIRLVLRMLFHRVATVRTPIGRKLRYRLLNHGGPLIRTKPSDLIEAGCERVARLSSVRDGAPMLEDGSVLDVANVIWSTGFEPGFSWIDLPVLDEMGWPEHDRGVVPAEPGLFFLGLPFIYAASSAMPHGLGRDAAYLARVIESRGHRHRTTALTEPQGSSAGELTTRGDSVDLSYTLGTTRRCE
jgi:putative flavoprotein involved in K+ transport